jgi:hypothetical protein
MKLGDYDVESVARTDLAGVPGAGPLVAVTLRAGLFKATATASPYEVRAVAMQMLQEADKAVGGAL